MMIGRVTGSIVLASTVAFAGFAFTVVPTHAQSLHQQCYTNCSKPPTIATGKVKTGFGGTAPAPNNGPAPVAGTGSTLLGPNTAGKPVSTLPNTGGALPAGNNVLPGILIALAMLLLAGTMRLRLWSAQRL